MLLHVINNLHTSKIVIYCEQLKKCSVSLRTLRGECRRGLGGDPEYRQLVFRRENEHGSVFQTFELGKLSLSRRRNEPASDPKHLRLGN